MIYLRVASPKCADTTLRTGGSRIHLLDAFAAIHALKLQFGS